MVALEKKKKVFPIGKNNACMLSRQNIPYVQWLVKSNMSTTMVSQYILSDNNGY